MSAYDYLIVGAGWAGSVCAERLASWGKHVLLVDKRPHVGGNAYDELDERGILVHRHGAHVYHCNSDKVHAYVSRFTEWRPYRHRVLSSTSRGLVPVPINQTTLEAFGGDLKAAHLEMIAPYTEKQWGPYAKQLAPTVLARIKTRDTDDDRYFTDAYQAMPKAGYTALFQRMLDHPRITVRTSTPFEDVPASILASQVEIIWTGPIDEFFKYRYGPLPYRSAQFSYATLWQEQAQPVAVINHPSPDVLFTRTIEFKHLTGQSHRFTTIAYEYPMAEGEPFWPVPTAASAAQYRRYEALARERRDVHFCGRLGTFRYLDMWAVVAQALKLSKRLIESTPKPAKRRSAKEEAA